MNLLNINKMIAKLNKLCSPAYFYLIISVIALVIILFDNMKNLSNNNVYCLGKYSCNVPNTTLVFLMKILYIAFWTFVLNCLCKSGYKKLAWFLVLLPFLLFFVLLALMILNQGVMHL
tara:strand:+ start:90 stop:443 length:354 start_codon:yes stop_codon:yes gene_type:complete